MSLAVRPSRQRASACARRGRSRDWPKKVAQELRADRSAGVEPPAMATDRIGSIPPSCAASNITPARSTRWSCLLDTKDDKGRPVRFGSVGGGGRYDGLVSRFRGEPVPATGFSIGVSRLQAALTLLGKIDTTPDVRPGRRHRHGSRPDRRLPGDGGDLRDAGIRAELYLGGPDMGAAQICRPPRRALRRHPGSRRDGARRGADQGPDRGCQGRRGDRHPTRNIARSARRNSRSRKTSWSRPCARCSADSAG